MAVVTGQLAMMSDEDDDLCGDARPMRIDCSRETEHLSKL